MAIKAQQTVIYVKNSTGALAAIEEVNNISGPDGKAKLIDTTHLTSTGKENLAGIPDWGQISLDLNFKGGASSMQEYLRTLYSSQAPARTFRIKVPDGAQYHTFTFEAIVSSFTLDIKTDDKVALKITLQISGAVAYAPPGQSPT